MSEKTEKPTEKKKKDLKRKGDVIKSEDVISSFQFITVFVFFIFFSKSFFREIKQIIIDMVSHHDYSFSIKIDIYTRFIINMFMYVSSLFIFLFFIAVFSTWLQTGIVMAWDKVKPSVKKINPATNFKSIFSFKNIMEQIKTLLKFLTITCFTLIFFIYFLSDMLSLGKISPEHAFYLFIYFVICLWGGVAIIFIIFAFFDVMLQKKIGEKNVNMSKDEVKREYKDSEGNPEIKSERKRMHQEIQSGSLSQKVKKSTFVLKNPTHIAICIYYEKGVTPLPLVLKDGEGYLAQKILNIAEENGIPIIENISLARALKRKIKQDEFITEEFFESIAEILRIVMNVNYVE